MSMSDVMWSLLVVISASVSTICFMNARLRWKESGRKAFAQQLCERALQVISDDPVLRTGELAFSKIFGHTSLSCDLGIEVMLLFESNSPDAAYSLLVSSDNVQVKISERRIEIDHALVRWNQGKETFFWEIPYPDELFRAVDKALVVRGL